MLPSVPQKNARRRGHGRLPFFFQKKENEKDLKMLLCVECHDTKFVFFQRKEPI
jgi:hypothetical protein